MSARSLLIHHDAQQRATKIQSYLAQTLLFLLAATLPLAQWQLPFLQSLQKADGGLQFFDLLATIAALFSVFSFLKKPCRTALFPWAYPLALSLPILLHRTPSSAWLLLMKPMYLAGLASTVLTLLSASESRGYRALRYGWLTGWMLTVVATVVGIVWFYLGYTDETINPFLFHYGSLQKGAINRS